MRERPKKTQKRQSAGSGSFIAEHATIARAATTAGASACARIEAQCAELDGVTTATDTLNLYYVVTPEQTFAVVAAESESAAREIPPYSNWRDILAFGGWDAAAGAKLRVTCIASPSTLKPGSGAGVVLAGGMGFYSASENALKFL